MCVCLCVCVCVCVCLRERKWGGGGGGGEVCDRAREGWMEGGREGEREKLLAITVNKNSELVCVVFFFL